ncbi:MAG: type I-E CRISPR-associated protein Cse2/CasB [Dissulfuribacterales bacterium]
MVDKDKQEKSQKVKDKQAETIFKWWASLENNRGDRAQLRRCEKPGDVMIQPAFHRLMHLLGEERKQPAIELATLAGILSHVQGNKKDARFAGQLGTPPEKGGNPVMSESRFQQLLKSKDWNELYLRLRRAVIMLKRQVNITSVSRCIQDWGWEFKGRYHENPSKRLQFRLAEEYYKEVLKKK